MWGDLLAARMAADVSAAAREAPQAPIVMHLFSGGGFLYSGLLLRALQRRGDLDLVAPRMAGVILDSSPAFVTADVTARALLASALHEPADGVERRHPRALSVLQGAVGAYLSLPYTQHRLRDTQAAWHELAPPCPKLYLYSESDVLVSPGTIQEHMQFEAVRGSRVYAHKWADTPHVEHYRLHPEEYTQQVVRFLEEALGWGQWSSSGGSEWTSGEWSGNLSVDDTSTTSSSSSSSSTGYQIGSNRSDSGSSNSSKLR